jgi:phosphoglycolate phosphatase
MPESPILFDLDGTLTDPKVGITKCIHHALVKLGVEVPSQDELTWCIGPPLRGSFAELVGEDQADEALRLYRERFSTVGYLQNEVYPGMADVLAGLAHRRSLVVATSKPQIYAEKIIDHFKLRRYFEAVYGSELDGTRSNKSELIASIPFGPESVMIGDRRHDMEGAKVNGLTSVGVMWGYGSRRELEAAGADRIIDQPTQLLKVV